MADVPADATTTSLSVCQPADVADDVDDGDGRPDDVTSALAALSRAANRTGSERGQQLARRARLRLGSALAAAASYDAMEQDEREIVEADWRAGTRAISDLLARCGDERWASEAPDG
jgi:hypothetical protein